MLEIEGQNGWTRMNVTLFSIVCLHLEEHIGVEFRAERSKNGTFARMQICFILDSGEVSSFT